MESIKLAGIMRKENISVHFLPYMGADEEDEFMIYLPVWPLFICVKSQMPTFNWKEFDNTKSAG
jgi:hypothetical protein